MAKSLRVDVALYFLLHMPVTGRLTIGVLSTPIRDLSNDCDPPSPHFWWRSRLDVPCRKSFSWPQKYFRPEGSAACRRLIVGSNGYGRNLIDSRRFDFTQVSFFWDGGQGTADLPVPRLFLGMSPP